MSLALSDRQLRRWYLDFNRRFHGGDLPDDVDVIYAPATGCLGRIDFDYADAATITINPACAFDMCMVKLTLHHEMAHLKVGTKHKHGKVFQAEMLRLATLGAFRGLW
ncbi:hypothetical protein [Silvibacterium acidisoli]|uniref:hypothetical protein n=1 Tax=Acidobacteriaceae bacterium ZG23-2 TaxID=2883246 RepID=UPI00406C5EF7